MYKKPEEIAASFTTTGNELRKQTYNNYSYKATQNVIICTDYAMPKPLANTIKNTNINDNIISIFDLFIFPNITHESIINTYKFEWFCYEKLSENDFYKIHNCSNIIQIYNQYEIILNTNALSNINKFELMVIRNNKSVRSEIISWIEMPLFIQPNYTLYGMVSNESGYNYNAIKLPPIKKKNKKQIDMTNVAEVINVQYSKDVQIDDDSDQTNTNNANNDDETIKSKSTRFFTELVADDAPNYKFIILTNFSSINCIYIFNLVNANGDNWSTDDSSDEKEKLRREASHGVFVSVMIAILLNCIGAFMFYIKVRESLVVINYGFILGPVIGFMLDPAIGKDEGCKDAMTSKGFSIMFNNTNLLTLKTIIHYQ